MCFSATASFIASASLISSGIYISTVSLKRDWQYVPLSLIPLAFGIQQGFEGLVWLGLNSNNAEWVKGGSLCFLFFSHGFWLVWMAFAALCLESRAWAKRVLVGTMVVGAVFALSLYGPFFYSAFANNPFAKGSFLGMSQPFSAIAHNGSIDYQTQLIYDQFLPRDVFRFIYLLIVTGPLGLSQQLLLRLLAGFGALSLVVTYAFFNYALVSVWCFFAAILSLFILSLLRTQTA